MSQQDNFVGGFLLGTVVGGVVGGVIGAIAASRLSQAEPANSEESFARKQVNKKEGKVPKKRLLKTPTEQNMEVARRGLEDKIAQLNDAIDEVRQQLGTVNGGVKEESREKGAIAQED